MQRYEQLALPVARRDLSSAMKNLPFPPRDDDLLVYHDAENVGKLSFDSLPLTYVLSGTFYGAEQ